MRDNDPALSFWRDPPLFYAALVIGLAALAGSTARHLRGEGAFGPEAIAAAEADALGEGQGPVVRVASDAFRVHSR